MVYLREEDLYTAEYKLLDEIYIETGYLQDDLLKAKELYVTPKENKAKMERLLGMAGHM